MDPTGPLSIDYLEEKKCKAIKITIKIFQKFLNARLDDVLKTDLKSKETFYRVLAVVDNWSIRYLYLK